MPGFGPNFGSPPFCDIRRLRGVSALERATALLDGPFWAQSGQAALKAQTTVHFKPGTARTEPERPRGGESGWHGRYSLRSKLAGKYAPTWRNFSRAPCRAPEVIRGGRPAGPPATQPPAGHQYSPQRFARMLRRSSYRLGNGFCARSQSSHRRRGLGALWPSLRRSAGLLERLCVNLEHRRQRRKLSIVPRSGCSRPVVGIAER
jgi:hypothetical protein